MPTSQNQLLVGVGIAGAALLWLRNRGGGAGDRGGQGIGGDTSQVQRPHELETRASQASETVSTRRRTEETSQVQRPHELETREQQPIHITVEGDEPDTYNISTPSPEVVVSERGGQGIGGDTSEVKQPHELETRADESASESNGSSSSSRSRSSRTTRTPRPHELETRADESASESASEDRNRQVDALPL